MKQRLRRRLIQFLVKHLFYVVSEDDMLTKTKNGWFIAGRPVDSEQMEKLRKDADAFKNSTLWKVYIKTALRGRACELMYKKSRTADDMLGGKMMVFLVEEIDKKLHDLSEI